ncbi:PREDICTED: putative protein shisa-8 [Nipponia nippon]|uniref:putative protein shisa-8 n=1 Tax=Nipponia nippon TaxID=128390 RepID=UPI0005110F39|nr:PREDICTED: putative protein shisa-8 [Nipponia nippon]
MPSCQQLPWLCHQEEAEEMRPPPTRVDETPEDPTRDKTNMIVYIICGVVAIMVLVGIFTKLGLEKAQGPQTEMTVSRTLTDLLKQPGHGPSEHMDGLMGGVQVPLGEGLARGPPRNGTGGGRCPRLKKPPWTTAVVVPPPRGRPQGHGKRLPLASSLALPSPAYAAYATLKAGAKAKGPKLAGGPAFPGGWDGGPPRGPRRPGLATLRPEAPPEAFGPATPLYGQPPRHLATNSKTEVTV